MMIIELLRRGDSTCVPSGMAHASHQSNVVPAAGNACAYPRSIFGSYQKQP